MKDYAELKRIAEQAQKHHPDWYRLDGHDWYLNQASMEMLCAASPAAILELVAEVERLRSALAARNSELSDLQGVLRHKNLALDALHHVWCDGGCRTGIHRWTEEELTDELVRQAEYQVKRMRTWLNNKQFRAMTPAEKAERIAKAIQEQQP